MAPPLVDGDVNDREDASTDDASADGAESGVTGGGGPVDLATARSAVDSLGSPIDRTDRVPLSAAAGRVTAEPLTAAAPVPRADLAAGEAFVPANARLDPAVLALAKAAGVDEATVRQRPTVGVVPTGSALVQRDPSPDERVETTGFLVAELAERWGAAVTYRNVVGDARPSLRAAVQRDLTRDALVVTGATPDGPVREVVADLGEVLVESLAAVPGGDVGLATVEGRPVLLFPPTPVDCLVGAVQLLRPLLGALEGAPPGPLPARRVELGADLNGDAGRTIFVPMRIEDGSALPVDGGDGVDGADGADGTDITPADAVDAGGWVTLDSGESREVGESVTVAEWRGR